MDATSNGSVAKLVKAWESKNGDRSKRIAGLGLMAVSLAACGGSDEVVAPVEPVLPPAPALSALQAQIVAAGQVFVGIDDNYDSAAEAIAENTTVLRLAGLEKAPTDFGDIEQALVDAVNAAIGELASSNSPIAGISLGAGFTSFIDGADFNSLLRSLTAYSVNDKLALDKNIADLQLAMTSAATANELQVSATKLALQTAIVDSAVDSAVEAKVIAATDSLAAAFVAVARADANLLTSVDKAVLNRDVAAKVLGVYSAAEESVADLIKEATGAEYSALLDFVVDELGVEETGLVKLTIKLDADSGVNVLYDDIVSALEGEGDEAPSLIINETGYGVEVVDYLVAKVNDTIGDLEIADINALLDLVQEISAIDQSTNAFYALADSLSITEGIVVRELFGDRTGSASDDYFFYDIAMGDASISKFGDAGTDQLILNGSYTFVEIDDEVDFNDSVGSAGALEIFWYVDETTGDTVMFVEKTAVDGSAQGGNNFLSQITLADFDASDAIAAALITSSATVLTSEAAALV